MIVTKGPVTLQRPDSEYYYWLGAGYTITGLVVPPTVKTAVLDDTTSLADQNPPDSAAWSASWTRAQILSLLATQSFRQAVLDIVGGGVTPPTAPVTGMALDSDGVLYPSLTGTAGLARDSDGVYYPVTSGGTAKLVLDTDGVYYSTGL